jgi:hypothetical protein
MHSYFMDFMPVRWSECNIIAIIGTWCYKNIGFYNTILLIL